MWRRSANVSPAAGRTIACVIYARRLHCRRRWAAHGPRQVKRAKPGSWMFAHTSFGKRSWISAFPHQGHQAGVFRGLHGGSPFSGLPNHNNLSRLCSRAKGRSLYGIDYQGRSRDHSAIAMRRTFPARIRRSSEHATPGCRRYRYDGVAVGSGRALREQPGG
jgi:hypothetical protein